MAFLANAKKSSLTPMVTPNTTIGAFPETALIAKLLDAKLPVPGLLQLPLIEEVRAGLERHTGDIIDVSGENSQTSASQTA